VVRPLEPDVDSDGANDPEPWEVAGLDVGDRDNWRLLPADLAIE
jgi:hypothetical protein